MYKGCFGYKDNAGYICYKLSFHADCGEAPPAPANGTRNVSGTTFGSIVNYTCDHGYYFSAQEPSMITLTCMTNGWWNGTAPQCHGM